MLAFKKNACPPLSPDFMNWRSSFLQGSLVSSRRSKCVTVSTLEDPQLWQPPRVRWMCGWGWPPPLTSMRGTKSKRVASPIMSSIFQATHPQKKDDMKSMLPGRTRAEHQILFASMILSLPRIPRIFNVKAWVFCGCFIRFYTTCVSPRKGGTSSQLRVLAPKNCGSPLILLTPTTPKTKSSINHPFKTRNHWISASLPKKPSTPKNPVLIWCEPPPPCGDPLLIRKQPSGTNPPWN